MFYSITDKSRKRLSVYFRRKQKPPLAVVLLRQMRINKNQLVEIQNARIRRNQIQPLTIRHQTVILLPADTRPAFLLHFLNLSGGFVATVRHTVQVREDEQQQLAKHRQALQPHLEQAVGDRVACQQRVGQALGKALYILRRDVAAACVPTLKLTRIEQLLDFHV